MAKMLNFWKQKKTLLQTSESPQLWESSIKVKAPMLLITISVKLSFNRGIKTMSLVSSEDVAHLQFTMAAKGPWIRRGKYIFLGPYELSYQDTKSNQVHVKVHTRIDWASAVESEIFTIHRSCFPDEGGFGTHSGGPVSSLVRWLVG